jgi:putative phage-type endonuclease
MRVNLTQGSEDWHIWRDKGIGGSDISVLMGTNPWTKLRDLWEQKTGRQARPDLSDNWAVQKGLRLEPVAREMYEQRTGNHMPDGAYVCDTEHRFKASLDGINLDEDGLLEIKVPGQKTHEGCGRGEVPDHYMDQMQWYMMVTGAEWCDFVTLYYYDDMPDLNIHRVLPDLERRVEMVKAGFDFLACLENDTPPGYTETDIEDASSDDEWGEWESELTYIDTELDRLNGQRGAIVDKMKIKAEFHGVRGAKYHMARSVRKGNLDYAKWHKDNDSPVPDDYRKKSTIVHSLKKVKQK